MSDESDYLQSLRSQRDWALQDASTLLKSAQEGPSLAEGQSEATVALALFAQVTLLNEMIERQVSHEMTVRYKNGISPINDVDRPASKST